MAIKLDSLGGIDWVDGDILEAADLVSTLELQLKMTRRGLF